MPKFSSDIEEKILDKLEEERPDWKVVSGTVQVDNFDFPSVHIIQGESNHQDGDVYKISIPVELYFERDAKSDKKNALRIEEKMEDSIDLVLDAISTFEEVGHYRVERINPLIGELNDKMFVGSQITFIALRKVDLHTS